MPILGMDVPESLVAATREALDREVNASALLHSAFPKATSFFLRRQPYTGDYQLYARTGAMYERIAKFGLLPMPGCRSICIFHHAEVEGTFRQRGVGRELLRIRLKVAKEVGYKMILATVRSDNQVELGLLIGVNFERCGWYINKEQQMIYLEKTSL